MGRFDTEAEFGICTNDSRAEAQHRRAVPKAGRDRRGHRSHI